MRPKTSIDWFGFRTKDTPDVILSALQDVIPANHALSLKERKTGFRSFARSLDLWITDTTRPDPDTACQRIGIVMTGGEAVRGWTMASISGEGCASIDNWGRAMDVCTEQLDQFDLKRVDVALDRFDGSHWHEVDAAWSAGQFASPGSGRPPKAKPIDSRRPEDGRTYYVGSRESAKFYRGYEKGMQILGPHLAAASERNPDIELTTWLDATEIRLVKTEDGNTVEQFNLKDWWRDEVEFKPVNQPLPLDLVERRDEYFAGAYPYLAKVLPMADTCALNTRRDRMPHVHLAKVLEIIKGQYGNSLFTALHAYRGDIGAVWEKIVGGKHNKVLIEAGVLMVDHD